MRVLLEMALSVVLAIAVVALVTFYIWIIVLAVPPCHSGSIEQNIVGLTYCKQK